MGLVDKLTELDEKIWKQYEKVTNYCNKEFGWNKYDLANKCLLGESAGMLGTGFYMGLDGVKEGNPFWGTIGVLTSLLSMAYYRVYKYRHEILENREIKLLQDGVVYSPKFKASRSLQLLSTIPLTSIAAYFLSASEPESTPYKGHFSVIGLYGIALSLLYFSQASKSYFQDQIMTPPKKKKSVLKSLYEKAMGKFQTVPVPQSGLTKHQSIDDLIA